MKGWERLSRSVEYLICINNQERQAYFSPAEYNKLTLKLEAINKIWNGLNTLDLKSKELQTRGFKTAAEKATQMHQNIKDSWLRYLNEDITGQQFKQQYTDSIHPKDRAILEEHRGWGKVLLNLGLAIAGLGVGYIVAGLVNLYVTNGQHFFFRANTATIDDVNHLEQNLALLP